MELLLGLAPTENTQEHMHKTVMNCRWLPHWTHLCTVGERFPAGGITLPNGSGTCLRGAAAYKKTEPPQSLVDFAMVNSKIFFFLFPLWHWPDYNSIIFYAHLLTYGPAVYYRLLQEELFKRGGSANKMFAVVFIPAHWHCHSIIWLCLRATSVCRDQEENGWNFNVSSGAENRSAQRLILCIFFSRSWIPQLGNKPTGNNQMLKECHWWIHGPQWQTLW